jgi:Domain of unknown function (DUF1996)
MTEMPTRNYAAWAAVALVVTLAIVLAFIAASAPDVSARSSDHGASFAVRCDFSHRAQADPIVHHGHPEMAHSHDFFGNRSTNAHSTYDDLLNTTMDPPTTCTRFEEDKAAYWIPTVSWNGKVLNSNRAVFYYRAGSKDHRRIQPYPAELKVIADGERRVKWTCGRADTSKGSRTPPTSCPGKTPELGVRIVFPDCVDVTRDGKPLVDSPNHRDHMAYSRRIDGKVRCPRSHPRSVPVLTMNATFPLPPPQDSTSASPGEVTLACSETPPSCAASTMHADFFNAWNQERLEYFVKTCINRVPPSQPRPAECQSPRL